MELYICIDIWFYVVKNLRLFYFYLCFIFIALQLKKKTLFNQGSVNHLVLKDTLLNKKKIYNVIELIDKIVWFMQLFSPLLSQRNQYIILTNDYKSAVLRKKLISHRSIVQHMAIYRLLDIANIDFVTLFWL